MKVFLSFAQEDRRYASIIEEKLRAAGHSIIDDKAVFRVGKNYIKKINQGIRKAEVFIPIVSSNALRSKWVLHEFSTIALGNISRQKRKVVPVLVDGSSVPQYLASYAYVDLTADFDRGIKEIVSVLSNSIIRIPATFKSSKHTCDTAISSLSQALHAGRLTLVCGAGVSVGAGVPSWNQLLVRLLESMMKRISANHDIPLDDVTANEFQKRYGPSSLVVGKYLKCNLGKDFMTELRDALYAESPLSCELVDQIVELSRPQRDGKPLESIITFNFDALIEEQLKKNNIRHKAIFAEGIRSRPNELPIFHVHGFLPRKGAIGRDAEVVFSEDAYHSQFIDSFSWSNLIQLNKLTQNTCLFLGLSLTDPNLRRLLDVASRKNPVGALNHYIVKKKPRHSEKSDTLDQLETMLEEQDANGLGLNVIWVNDFSGIAQFLHKLSGA